LDKGPGPFDAVHRHAENFVPRFVQLEFAMDFRRGQKDVDAAALAGGLEGVAGGVNVARNATGQSANYRPLDFFGDGLDGGKVAVADDGEASFDHIDLEAGQLAGDFELFAQIHGGAGALLAVAQGGIEYDDSVVFHNFFVKAKTPTPFIGDGV
jgi:hypothetical protein